MKMTETHITIGELTEGYSDKGDEGVTSYNGKLTIRPAYQREFVYKDKQRDAVIDSIFKGYPLNVMYWAKTGEDEYEVLDGQQRTMSAAKYVTGEFSFPINGVPKYWQNLTETEKKQIADYSLTIYICEGTEEEKLAWFKVINIAGETLTEQELLNATFTGPWLSDAKTYFSKRGCIASAMADGYVKGNPIRQEYLEKVLDWIADRDGLESGQMYMAKHQQDEDANELWGYYQDVINWAKKVFPVVRKGVTDCQKWGILYNKYHNNTYNSNKIEEDIKRLLTDDDVTKNAGIIEYVLTDRSRHNEKYLSIRAFTESQKRRAYEKQNHICPCCGKTFSYEEMQGDHIVPWSKGGRTVDENLQMLCSKCNNDKSNK